MFGIRVRGRFSVRFGRFLAPICLAVLVCAHGAGADAQSLKIAVIGGGGLIGSRIAREAADRGHDVTVIVRDPSRVTLGRPRLTAAEGDVLDTEQLTRQLAAYDVVVSAVGSARAQSPDPSLYVNAAKSLVEGIRRIDGSAPRLIVVGGVGSLETAAGGLILDRVPEARRPEHMGQKAALDYYRTVEDVNWTYVSPPAVIAPGERKGVYRRGENVLLTDEKGESRISMEDYAVALVDEIEHPRAIRKRFTVAY